MRKRALSKKEVQINNFYKFLLKHDAFIEYKENVRKCNWTTLRSIFNEDIGYWITDAFRWPDTAEDSEYWSKLASEWNIYCRNKIK